MYFLSYLHADPSSDNLYVYVMYQNTKKNNKNKLCTDVHLAFDKCPEMKTVVNLYTFQCKGIIPFCMTTEYFYMQYRNMIYVQLIIKN